MGIAVLLVDGRDDVPLGADAVARLSRLGVTHVALVGDGCTAGLVLEGWAFEPRQSAAAAAAALGIVARTLHPLVQLAVTTARPEGETT